MNVLMIGGDKNMLTAGTEAYRRFELQRGAVESLDLFVWPQIHSRRVILKAAKAKHYDVVTASDPFWRGLLALHAARRARAKLNVQVHVDLTHVSLFRRLLARFILRCADSVRVVSEHLKVVVEQMGVKKPIHVLPVYLNLESFRTLMHHKHPRYFRTILWIGRFEPEKNPLIAIEVVAAARKAGIDACLIMLGEGSLKEALMRAARDFQKCVEFPGWMPPAPYLAMADVVVSTSDHESYGASIVEALAAGVPVVSPDYGIAREAGATVVPRSELAKATMDILRSGTRGTLKLPMLDAGEWTRRWVETLV